MSQQKLADCLSHLMGDQQGWTQRTVLRIEQGERPLRLGEALVIATALNVPLLDLTAGLDDSIAAMTERAEAARRNTSLSAALALLPNLGPDEMAVVRAALGGAA